LCDAKHPLVWAIVRECPLSGTVVAMKDRFLVVCDYGQGGVWGYVLAPSRDEVVKRYPELDVIDEPPAWMKRRAARATLREGRGR
jgi:hypothetical protein